MPFIGTIANFAVVLVMGVLGALLKKGIPQRVSDAIISGMGICVVYIGVEGALSASAPTLPEGAFFSGGVIKILVMIISVAIGTLIGELVDFDSLITRLGDYLEKKMSGSAEGGKSNFSRGFVSASMLFCVGAMAVNGALQDGLGNPDILLAKTVIDGIVCFLMATTLGVGCAFSAFLLLVYQGAIAVGGYFLASFIPMQTIEYMSATGSLIVVLIGTNLLGATHVKTANMVPAMFVPLALAPLVQLLF